MDDYDKDLDDILGLTDSETSSDSSNPKIYRKKNQAFVLELHDLKKDDPVTDKATPEPKLKKKKKRGQPAEQKSGSAVSSSSSDSIPTVTDVGGKEEFYDADGSFHDLPALDSQAKPTATAALAQAQSEHSQGPKTTSAPATPSQHLSATPRTQSNTVTKPVAPPE